MEFRYNTDYYDGKKLKQLANPRQDALRTYSFDDGVIVGIFQGRKGERPDVDFIIRILRPGEDARPFALQHAVWVTDLILKAEYNPVEVGEIMRFYIRFYDDLKPFETPMERDGYELRTPEIIRGKFPSLKHTGTLTISTVATMLELFCFCEKRSSRAFMFRRILHTVLQYTEGKADYMHLMDMALRRY